MKSQHAEDQALQFGEPDALRASFVNGACEPQRGVEVEAPTADAQIGVDKLAEAFGKAPIRIRLKRRAWRQDLSGEQPRHDALKAILLRRFEPRIVVEEIHTDYFLRLPPSRERASTVPSGYPYASVCRRARDGCMRNVESPSRP